MAALQRQRWHRSVLGEYSQSDAIGNATGGFAGYLIALMIAANGPRGSANHRLKRKITRITRWIVRRPFANGLLVKISSGTNRQLTVHLYRNIREKSKAPARYSQGYSRRNGRPRRPCKATMTATCPIVVRRPFSLHVTTMIPGRYSIFDIFTDRAPLDHTLVSIEVPVAELTHKVLSQSLEIHCNKRGWMLEH